MNEFFKSALGVLSWMSLFMGAELLWHFFVACFVSLVGGCSRSFFHMFIGFATVLIDFLVFVLFPLSFSLVFKSGTFSMVFVDFSLAFDFSLVFVTFPCFSMFLFGLLG